MLRFSRFYGSSRRFFAVAAALILSGAVLCDAAGPAADNSRYIGLDEITPAMKAWCLTQFSPAGIEKFDLEVVDVVRSIEPGRDAILVKGLDERFIHTGPVGGCSGSPVYIDGRLAGALAFAWTSSKDPLYGVTPIGEMLEVGLGGGSAAGSRAAGYAAVDLSGPLSFAEIERQVNASTRSGAAAAGAMSLLPCPVTVSGLSAGGVSRLEALLAPMGMTVIAGAGGGSADGDAKATFEPGSCLMIPLVSGDISLSVQGTVTEVRGDTIYGFGHSFLGFGKVDLPMATGRVHTVVSSLVRSFKLASVEQMVGALRHDESAAVVGRIGAQADTFELTINVDHYADVRKRTFHCRVANCKEVAPSLVRSVVAGAALVKGELPGEHTIEYRATLTLADGREVAFDNISTDFSLDELSQEVSGAVGMLMNNPYEQLTFRSMDFDIRVTPQSRTAHLWSVDISDSTVKPGQKIEVEVIAEPVLKPKKKYRFELQVPEDVKPGKYSLQVCGNRGYEMFLTKSAPHRLVAQNIPGLIEALNYLLSIRRNRLYCILSLPPGGLTLETEELPDLPGTVALVMRSENRTTAALPYRQWIEKSVDIDTVVIDRATFSITVEKP